MRPILIACLLFLVACDSPAQTATPWPTPTWRTTSTPLPAGPPRPPDGPFRVVTPLPDIEATMAAMKAWSDMEVRIAAASRATATAGSRLPISAYACPATHRIKGNLNTMIYHMPGQEYYTRTKPEQCFALEVDAIMLGYRKALR